MSARFIALRSASFRRFWLGSVASVSAAQLTMFALGWLMFELTRSPAMLGVLGAALSIPTILMTLGGGVLADRLDRRRLLMLTSTVLAVLLGILTLLDASALVRPWHLLLISGLMGLAWGIDWPSRTAVFPSLIPREHLSSAVVLNSILWQAGRMLMPAVGGVVIGVVDTALLFAMAVAGNLLMLMALRGLHLPHAASLHTEPNAGGAIQALIKAARYVLENRLFWVLVGLSYALTFFGASVQQQLPAFAALFESGELGYGVLMSCTGIGSLAGTVVLGDLQSRPSFGRIMLSAAVLSALALLCFSLLAYLLPQPGIAFVLAALLLCLCYVASSIFLVMSMTALQLRVPEHLRGRVMALHGITFSLIPLGALFSGTLASLMGIALAMALSAGILLLMTGLALYSQHEIR